MTETEKIELKAALNVTTDLLYNKFVESIEFAEATLPAETPDAEKHAIITNLIKSVFEAQQKTFTNGFNEVQEKIKDPDFINKAREALNVGQS